MPMGRPPVAGAPAGGERDARLSTCTHQICRLARTKIKTLLYGSAKKTERLYHTELGGEMVRTDLYTTKTSDLVRSGRRGNDLCHMIGGGVRGEVWGTEARELLRLVRVRLGSG